MTADSPPPRETLLHLCGRLGLEHVAAFLLCCPGAEIASRTLNPQRWTPLQLAAACGHHGLVDLLQGYACTGLTAYVGNACTGLTAYVGYTCTGLTAYVGYTCTGLTGLAAYLAVSI